MNQSKFEYRTEIKKDLMQFFELNELGEDGWNLITLIPLYNPNRYCYIFKKEYETKS